VAERLRNTGIYYSAAQENEIYELFRSLHMFSDGVISERLRRRTQVTGSDRVLDAIKAVMRDRGRTSFATHIFPGAFSSLNEHPILTGNGNETVLRKLLRADCVPSGIFRHLVGRGEKKKLSQSARLWFGLDCLGHLVERTMNRQHSVKFGTDVQDQPVQWCGNEFLTRDIDGEDDDQWTNMCEDSEDSQITITSIGTVFNYHRKSYQYRNIFRKAGYHLYGVTQFSALVDFEKCPEDLGDDVTIIQFDSSLPFHRIAKVLFESESMKEKDRFCDANIKKELECAMEARKLAQNEWIERNKQIAKTNKGGGAKKGIKKRMSETQPPNEDASVEEASFRGVCMCVY